MRKKKLNVTELVSRVAVPICLIVLYLSLARSTEAENAPHFCHVDTAKSALAASSVHTRGLVGSGGVILLVNKNAVSPGGHIYARLANFGESQVGYGREFAIERRTAVGWEIDPASPKGPWPEVLGRLRPGLVGRCFQFVIPDQQPFGAYRFATKVHMHLGGRLVRKTARFVVGAQLR